MKRWLVFVSLAVALFCLAYPIYVIRPFRQQGSRELAIALQVMEWRLPIGILCSLVAIAVTAFYWRRSGRTLVLTATVLTIACAALSRVNIYEQMFHPLGEPAFLPIGEVTLAADEKVLAVNLNRTARAYPVRGISYHHVVNDTVDGVPIVATY